MDDPVEALPDEDATRIGRVLASKYRLLRLLGKGGMGAVYEAENTWTHRRVAVKLLRAELSSDRHTVSRFLQEARAASALQHPHIVDVLDMGREPGDNTLYIVQEFLEGVTLRARMTEAGRLEPAEAVRVLAPILSALEAAHARGIVHRDIKPENIFLTRGADGALAPKLIDFGISKVVGEDFGAVVHKTRTGSMLGTPAYMSPEQARGDRTIDARADIWSAGVVLYELLCGRGPFDGESFGLLISQIMTAEIPRVETFAPDLPHDLAEVVHRALVRDRAKRHASAGAFREALLACATDRLCPRPDRAPDSSFVHSDTLPASGGPTKETPAEAPVARPLSSSATFMRAPSRWRAFGVGAAVFASLAFPAWWSWSSRDAPHTLAGTTSLRPAPTPPPTRAPPVSVESRPALPAAPITADASGLTQRPAVSGRDADGAAHPRPRPPTATVRRLTNADGGHPTAAPAIEGAAPGDSLRPDPTYRVGDSP